MFANPNGTYGENVSVQLGFPNSGPDALLLYTVGCPEYHPTSSSEQSPCMASSVLKAGHVDAAGLIRSAALSVVDQGDVWILTSSGVVSVSIMGSLHLNVSFVDVIEAGGVSMEFFKRVAGDALLVTARLGSRCASCGCCFGLTAPFREDRGGASLGCISLILPEKVKTEHPSGSVSRCRQTLRPRGKAVLLAPCRNSCSAIATL